MASLTLASASGLFIESVDARLPRAPMSGTAEPGGAFDST
jgi:hypothetical protein